MKRVLVSTSVAVFTASTVLAGAIGAPAAHAATSDPFYTYSGSKPLASYAPGAILKSRTVSYSITGGSGSVVQLLYRSTDAQGRANAAVTSVFKPASPKPVRRSRTSRHTTRSTPRTARRAWLPRARARTRCS